MQVYLLKDIENVGMAGQVIKVSDGYASNYLIPKKLAKIVTEKEFEGLKTKIKKQEVEKKVLNSKLGMLAERIKSTVLTIKKKIHDDNKLYGSISPDEIVDLLKEKEIIVNKKQVEFSKNVKTIGEHKVIIKLSSKVLPELTVKIVALEEKK